MKTKNLFLTFAISCFVMVSFQSLKAANPEVVNGVATYHSSKNIGPKFQVPDSWDKILIKENVTITGSFYMGSRSKAIEIAGESRTTSIIQGDGSRPTNDGVNGRTYSAIRCDGSPDLYVHDLRSLNPMKFHIHGGFGNVTVERCDLIENRGIHTTDGVHGGRGKTIVRDCYINTWDDALYTIECKLVENTTIVHNKNGGPFMTSWGASVPDNHVCIIRNCKVIDNYEETNYNHGVVSWAGKSDGGSQTITLKFEGTFEYEVAPGKKSSTMYTIGRPNDGGINDAHIVVDGICFRSSSVDTRYSTKSDVKFKNCDAPVYAPVANAGADQAVADADGNGSESVSLNGSASTDSDGTIASYIWTEGGSQIATGATPSVTLPVGTHNITLTVTDNEGNTNTDQVTITVTGIVSLPGLVQVEDYTAQSGVQTESTTDAGGGLNVGWINNGDWTEYEVVVQQSGIYTVDLRVASGLNGGTINILSNGSNIGSASVNGTGGWQSWTTVSTAVSLAEGAQTIRLVYTGGTGFLLNINWIEFSTSINQQPIADAGSNQTVNDADDSGDETVTLNGTGSSDPDGTIESYVWTKDGTQIATGVSPSVSLPVGVHDITLTVTDNNGATASDNVTVTVTGYVNQAPVANAGADQVLTDSDDNGSELVTLDASASSDTDGTIVSYVWTEGGSQIATGVSPEVSFTVGTHTVILMVTDDNGASSTDEVVIVIDAGGCNGLPIAGIIEAEDYTAQSGINTESTSDAGSGLNVGWINNGDYTEYEVCVAESGIYNVDIRVAAAQNGGTINILENGTQVGSVAVSVTGGWQSWKTVSTTVNLSQGAQTLRLAYSGGSGFLLNINWMEFIYGGGANLTYYYITNKSQQKNIRPASKNVNAQVVQAADGASGDDVQWGMEETSNGYFYLKNKESGLYMSMEDASDGSSIVQIAQNNLSAKSEWITNTSPDGEYVYLVNRSSGKHIRPNTSDIASPIVAQPNTWVGDWTRWLIVDANTFKSANYSKDGAESMAVNSSDFKLYPNPTSIGFTIELLIANAAKVVIYDLAGKIVFDRQIQSDNSYFDVSSLAKGTYVVKVSNNGKFDFQKLVIQ